ncbi:hypothetical protein [Calothrix sp. NIES-3974]|nr:hypothetical protein [Calothrix sp. NIES-3974]BAZ05107.1 hypothetical protein NIES3974_17530 [Calothrix sp. NIES-3974]
MGAVSLLFDRTYALVTRNQVFGIATLEAATARLPHDPAIAPLREEVQ